MGDTCGCGCRPGATAAPDVAGETVEDVMRRLPRAAEILRGLGVDTCCGGRLTLSQAAASAGVPVDILLGALGAGGESTGR